MIHPPSTHLADAATSQPLPAVGLARRVFFPNLNSLRFLAVLLVIIDHVESICSDFGLSSFWSNPALPMLG